MSPSAKGTFFDSIGPMLTTWALKQVVSFLGYTGRAANVAATVESDPNLPFTSAFDLGELLGASSTRRVRNEVAADRMHLQFTMA
jgi:hypothetical protein